MSQITIGQDTKMNSGLVLEYQTVTGNHTMTSTSGAAGGFDYAIGCGSDTAAITINLPTTSGNGMEAGRMYYVFDKDGNAGTNNITIDAQSGATISGSQTYTIDAAYNSVTIMCIAANTWIIV